MAHGREESVVHQMKQDRQLKMVQTMVQHVEVNVVHQMEMGVAQDRQLKMVQKMEESTLHRMEVSVDEGSQLKMVHGAEENAVHQMEMGLEQDRLLKMVNVVSLIQVGMDTWLEKARFWSSRFHLECPCTSVESSHTLIHSNHCSALVPISNNQMLLGLCCKLDVQPSFYKRCP